MDEKQSEKHRSIVVRRRLDRTPDKSSRKLKDTEKITITSLRTALEEAKIRTEKLKDENELKDSFIHEEKQLQINIENKLEGLLVDLYNNPQVNWELRQRLPRANKMDPMETKPSTFLITTHDSIWKPLPDDDHSPQFIQESTSPLTSYSATSIDSYQSLPSVNHMTDSYQSLPSVNQGTDLYQPLPAVNHMTDLYQSLPAVNHMTDLYQSLPAVSQDQMLTRAGAFLPETLSDAAVHTQLQERPIYPHPPKSSESHPLNYKSAESHPLNYKSSESHPLNYKSSESHPLNYKSAESHPLNYKSAESHPLNYKSAESHPPNFKSAESHPPNFKSAESSHLHPAQRDMSSLIPSLRSSQVPSDVSQISRVIAELVMLKKENHTLREELKSAQAEIKKLKTKQEHSLENIGGLIEELRSAEKQREAALVMMVQSAEADKMAALGDLTRLSSKYESCCTNVGESDLSQLVSRQREIMQEEMQRVLEQRDEARQKVVLLEKQLSSLELSGHYSPDNKLLVKLQITRDERDKLVQKLNLLLQEIGETKLVYNLHKALLSDGVKNNVVSEMLRYEDGQL